LIAEKSWNKPVIGFFARLAGAVPVARPQDNAFKGQGKVTLHGIRIIGQGTRFTTQLQKLDKIRPSGSANPFKIKVRLVIVVYM
jgi:glycerol-3-phosphate O-acyltransferase/dihydroxyacetone phosphate acyltransferase